MQTRREFLLRTDLVPARGVEALGGLQQCLLQLGQNVAVRLSNKPL